MLASVLYLLNPTLMLKYFINNTLKIVNLKLKKIYFEAKVYNYQKLNFSTEFYLTLVMSDKYTESISLSFIIKKKFTVVPYFFMLYKNISFLCMLYKTMLIFKLIDCIFKTEFFVSYYSSVDYIIMF